MRNKLIPFFVIGVLILITPIAFSLEDFEVGAVGGERRLCPTHTETITIPIENKGDEEISFTISLSGAAQKWTVAAPSGFSLAAGEIKSVYVWITPSSKSLPGLYDLSINIDGGSAGEEELNYDIIVESCHDVTIEVDDDSKESCPGEEVSYEFTVKNTGEYTENFVLSLSGEARDWATLSKQSFKLDKDEEEKITLYIDAPSDEIGEYELTLTVESKNSDAIDSEEVELLLESCYEYSISLSKDIYSFCDHTNARIPILIKNDGLIDNIYSIDVDGPDWANIEIDEVFIEKGNQKVVNLTIFPDYYETGEYDIDVNILSKTGEISRDKEVQLSIIPCFITDLKISVNEDKICAESSKTYEVSVTNSGKFKEPYNVYVDGPDWANLDKSFIELDEGETETINLIISAPETTIGEQTIRVVAESQEPSKTSDEDTLELEVLSKEVCFSISLTAELTEIDIAKGEGALIPILLENKGKETATYDLEVSGAGTSFAQLNPSTITIESGKTEKAHLYIAIPEEAERDEYTLSVSARLKEGTIQASDNIYVTVVAQGAGVDIENVDTDGEEQETDNESGIIIEDDEEEQQQGGILNSIKSTISGAASTVGNKITGAFAGVTGVELIKDNWKYIVGAIIVILILILLWQGTKEENTEDALEEKEETDEEELKREKPKKAKKKKKKIANKIRELLEEDEED